MGCACGDACFGAAAYYSADANLTVNCDPITSDCPEVKQIKKIDQVDLIKKKEKARKFLAQRIRMKKRNKKYLNKSN